MIRAANTLGKPLQLATFSSAKASSAKCSPKRLNGCLNGTNVQRTFQRTSTSSYLLPATLTSEQSSNSDSSPLFSSPPLIALIALIETPQSPGVQDWTKLDGEPEMLYFCFLGKNNLIFSRSSNVWLQGIDVQAPLVSHCHCTGNGSGAIQALVFRQTATIPYLWTSNTPVLAF